VQIFSVDSMNKIFGTDLVKLTNGEAVFENVVLLSGIENEVHEFYFWSPAIDL